MRIAEKPAPRVDPACWGPDLSMLGEAMLAPFVARRLRKPALVWINRRWFREQGVDLSDADTEMEVRALLLRDFGVAVPGADDPQTAFGLATATLQADRYGLSNGAWHGGSGRCGAAGSLHAKGIGRTPLVSAEADAAHSSGMMYLAEAIFEAIAAEVAGAELPCGAVPAVAIIDMGFASPVPGARPARRGILVRPNFVRPAHFERSMFFGKGGSPGSEQWVDARRVRDAVRATMRPDTFGGDPARLLRTIVIRSARQIGAAHAHRLWPGLLTSANRSVDGAFSDMGAFKAAPSWREARGGPGERFGGEAVGLERTVESLGFYFRKYLPPEVALPAPAALHEMAREEIAVSFRAACAAAIGLADASHPVLDALQAYFARQQRERIAIADRSSWRRPWLLDALAPGWHRGKGAGSAEVETAAHVEEALRDDGDAAARAGRLNATRRWLMPRYAMFHELTVPRIPKFVRTLEGDPARDEVRVSMFIDRQIACSRRLWAGAPRELEIGAQCCAAGDALLSGYDHRRREHGVWVVGTSDASGATAFGVRMSPEPGESPVECDNGGVALWMSATRWAEAVHRQRSWQRGGVHPRRHGYVYPFGDVDQHVQKT